MIIRKRSASRVDVQTNVTDTTCNWRTWNGPQRLEKGAKRVENRRTNLNHPNWSIVEISQNTEKSPGELRRLDVTQTPRARPSANALYNYGMIFLYKSFFVNYILSFSLVGLWTIRLLVQVHRHWVQFTLVRRGYDNHSCHNKPQIGNVTGVWMMLCPKAMVLRIWVFWKRRQLSLDCGPVELIVYWGPVQFVVEWGPVKLLVDLGHVDRQ